MLHLIKDLFILEEPVTVGGWVKSVRVSKKFSFIMLSDGSSVSDLQIIVDQDIDGYKDISKLLTGSSISVTGKIVPSSGKQNFEMRAESVKIHSSVTSEYPLQKKESSFEFLREQSHLRCRTTTFNSIFSLRHTLAKATHDFFDKESFKYIHTPIITGSDCEGAGELFKVSTLEPGALDFSKDYFGKKAYLSVSGQLEAEALALGMGRVYTFGPTFRSEKSLTSRHLSEFWMIEPEAAFFTLEDDAILAEKYIKYLISEALTKCSSELEHLSKTYKSDSLEKIKNVLESKFVKITYTDAIEILSKVSGFEYPVKWGLDLQTEHERFLAEKYFMGPVIVTDYPKDIKAFYMKLNDDQKTVRAMDILVPGVGEIIGGSQREDDYDKLILRMQEMKIDLEPYWWYLQLRKYGSVPHSGFGLGFERIIMYISGISNIRDVIPFPRYPGYLEF